MSRPFADYDMQHHRTVDVVMGYSEWALSYDCDMSDEFDIALLERLDSIHWSEFHRAIDLACGTGRIGAWLKAHGVGSIDGVDLTEAMLCQAQAKHIYDELFTEDITATSCASHAYQLAISVLSACHIAYLLELYREAARLVEPDGCFILADYHPFFLLRGKPTNFQAATGEVIAIENYVHLFSDHVQAARQTGWILAEMHERVVDHLWVEQQPAYARHLHQPISFVMVWKRMPIIK